MILEGNTSVIEALKVKKALIAENKPHDHIRPLVIVDGGLMKGVYAIGAGLVFEELGYRPVFSNIVGVSAGAVSAAYFVAGQVNIGSTLIYEECCSSKFFNIWNWKNILNSLYIEEVLRGKTNKELATETIFKSETNLYIGVTEFESAKPELIKTNDEDELITALRASISVPAIVSDKIMLGGKRYVDGFMSQPHVITKVLESIPATHVLILTNQDKEITSVPWYEKFLNNTIFRKRFSSKLLRATNNRDATRRDFFTSIKSSQPICIVWGDGSIGSLERNPKKAREVINKSKDWWRNLLEK